MINEQIQDNLDRCQNISAYSFELPPSNSYIHIQSKITNISWHTVWKVSFICLNFSHIHTPWCLLCGVKIGPIFVVIIRLNAFVKNVVLFTMASSFLMVLCISPCVSVAHLLYGIQNWPLFNSTHCFYFIFWHIKKFIFFIFHL